MTPEQRRAFIVEHTTVDVAPLVPEIPLRLGGEAMPLWEAAALADMRPAVPPPYWAYAWPGGQVLARYVLDHPDVVRGRSVLDVGAGGGIVAIAAARSGAKVVTAVDVEPFAIEACRVNAVAAGADVRLWEADPAGIDDGWDVVLVGDLWYEQTVADRIGPWLRTLAARGATVLTGDLGRAYLPADGLETLARSTIATTLDLEDATEKEARVLRFPA